MQTMWEALRICLPITLMTFAIFTRTDMVVNPGWPQVAATVLVLIGTSGTAFAMFGRFAESPVTDILLRVVLAVVAFVTLFHPDATIAIAAAMVVLPATMAGIWRHQRIAPKTGALQSQPVS
jgi:TRAP-type uncharacterized transport system fused permease subunit